LQTAKAVVLVNTRMIIGFHKNRISVLRERKLACLTTPHREDTYIIIIIIIINSTK